MKSLGLRKINRFYIWIILLVLAAIVFILLRSPATGYRQATQDFSELNVSAIKDEAQSSNQPSPAISPESSTGGPLPSPDDGNLRSAPEIVPDPWPEPQPPYCPLYLESSYPYFWLKRCLPCPLPISQ